jgi:hypothetical protein
MFSAEHKNERQMDLTWQYSSRSPKINYTISVPPLNRDKYVNRCKRDWLIKSFEKYLATAMKSMILSLHGLQISWPEFKKPCITQKGEKIAVAKQTADFRTMYRDCKELKSKIPEWLRSNVELVKVLDDVEEAMPALQNMVPSEKSLFFNDMDETLIALQQWIDEER